MSVGYLFIIAAATCWGFIGIFSTLAFSLGVSPLEVGFWRAALASIFFAAQATTCKQTTLHKRDLPFLLLFAVFGIALFYVSYMIAVNSGGAAFAAVLLYTAPAWVVCISFFLYGEKFTPMKLFAVFLVILGVFLISKSGGNAQSLGSLSLVALTAGLASGFCYSLYYTMGKYFSSRYSPANLFLYALPLGALLIFPFVEFVEKSYLAWLAILAISFFSTYLANFCYYKGLQTLEAGRASIVATMEPVIAAITAYIFFGEHFTPLGYCGTLLILGAVLTTIYEKQSPSTSKNGS